MEQQTQQNTENPAIQIIVQPQNSDANEQTAAQDTENNIQNQEAQNNPAPEQNDAQQQNNNSQQQQAQANTQQQPEKKNPDAVLLNKVYQNSQLGVKAVRMIREKVQDEAFREVLNDLEVSYQDIMGKAAARLSQIGETIEESGFKNKLMLWWGIQSNTIFDSSRRKIAEMMIRGCTNGITDMIETLNDNCDADKKTRDIAEHLMHTEEHQFDKLKAFLVK